MRFEEFESLISTPRITKYRTACANDCKKTICLYRGNIRISRAFLAILSVFEIVLRNKIDNHYRSIFPPEPGRPDWLLKSILPGGFLTQNGCQRSQIIVNRKYRDLGARYTHDRLVAELSFGFWKYLFAGNQYRAGGYTLLRIFPNIPPRHGQSFIYHQLDKINAIRNRVAHHEPICFHPVNCTINKAYARARFQETLNLLEWMNIDSRQLFYGVNGVLKEADRIDNI